MHHLDWFKLRYKLTRDYPGCMMDIGSINEAHEFEGSVSFDKYKDINPKHYPDHFRLLKWYEHRTLEQFLSIKYMKVKCSGCGYYGNGDIVEVTLFMYNNPTIVDGQNALLFNLQGHFYVASQLEPASAAEYEKFKAG